MIQYNIIQNKLSDRPSISFEGIYSIMNEINSCDYDYLIDDVMPNLEKIRQGELLRYPDTDEGKLVDSYEFGYTATMIDFYKNKSIIDNTWDDDFIKIEVPSEDIYQFMKEWTDKLIKWRNSQNV